MAYDTQPLHFPNYQSFENKLASLILPFSGSELHGVMCGYLCAGAISDGEAYLRALLVNDKNDAETTREVALSIFDLYYYSQQQIDQLDFSFHLLLPDDEESLLDRAKAFSEWCQGFTDGMAMAGINQDYFHEEESRQALQHFVDFAQLDYDALDVDEADEKALTEVTEYARMAVLRLHADLQTHEKTAEDSNDKTIN